jgi:hypothetical protein
VLDAFLEDELGLFVNDELIAKRTERALGKRYLLITKAQGQLPSLVEPCTIRRFLVRDSVERLQDQRCGQETRRGTLSAIVQTIEHRKVLITEQLVTMVGV